MAAVGLSAAAAFCAAKSAAAVDLHAKRKFSVSRRNAIKPAWNQGFSLFLTNEKLHAK